MEFLRRVVINGALISLALGFALVLAEVVLRIAPISGIGFNVARYDDTVGGAFYPNSTLLYRNDRGETATRRINDIGYLDINHEPEKPDGILRIGFFGDSYTEARQVELEDTFFRLADESLSDVETLAFGISGFSILQSFLTYTMWDDHFDLDLIVYVFVENDPGDNIPELKKSKKIPYPILSDTGFDIDNSFRSSQGHRDSLIYRIGDYLTSKSLLLSTISERLRLLLRYGTKLNVTEEDRLMSAAPVAAAGSGDIPGSDDLPSTWPDDLRERARATAEAIILKWSEAVREDSRHFAILYVPRAMEMHKPSDEQDSWKHWLETFCAGNRITFIDPSGDLLDAQSRGEEVFYDHLTARGHAVFANSFVRWFQEEYSSSAPGARSP